MAKPVVSVNVSHIDFAIPGKFQKKPELLEHDENGDGRLNDLDANCDNKCRAEAFLTLFGPQWKNEAQRDYFIDLADILFSVKVAYSQAFCLNAFMKEMMPDDSKAAISFDRGLPCCTPLDYSAIAFADNAIRNAAKKYGWIEQSSFVGVVKGPRRSWLPTHGFTNVSIDNPDDVRLASAIIVPPEQINEISGEIFAELIPRWNMIATLASDAENLRRCVPSIELLLAMGKIEESDELMAEAEKTRRFNGFTLPIFQVGR